MLLGGTLAGAIFLAVPTVKKYHLVNIVHVGTLITRAHLKAFLGKCVKIFLSFSTHFCYLEIYNNHVVGIS